MERAFRALAILAGALIMAAVAHVTVVSTGGYGTAQCWVTMAVAAGAAVSGVCVGLAWSAGRHALAVCFVVAVVAGEVFGFIQTGDRLIAGREAQQAPLRDVLAKHTKATKRVADAEAALAKIDAAGPGISRRLAEANAAKEKADAAVVEKSAEKGCAVNCRALLQAQVDAAAKEVEVAREELSTRHSAARSTAAAELNAAREALAAIKVPESATPLADRLGWAPWALDLVTAAAGSIAANGLGICLLVFGAHRSAPHEVKRAPQEMPKNAEIIEGELTEGDPGTFLATSLQPGTSVLEDDVCLAYEQWCATRGCTPMPRAKFKAAFVALCTHSGFKRSRGKVLGMRLTRPAQLGMKRLGHMATRRA